MTSIVRRIGRWLLLLVAVIFILALALYAFLQTPTFGAQPTAAQIKSFSQSPQFDVQTEEFRNRRPNLFNEMREKTSIPNMLREWFKDRPEGSPKQRLPEVKPDLAQFMENTDDTKIIWFGHSTFLLNMSGTIILVDPVFSEVASPVNFIGQRFQPPVISLPELPPIDVLLLSHDHYDHLDMDTIRFFMDKPTTFIAPLGVGEHLRYWGVSDDKIIEKDWWESYEVDGVEFIATPSQHFSGRDGINNNGTLWASWVIRTKRSNLFFSGDSGFDTHFKVIGDRYGPFDLALVEDGQYDKKWPAVHLFPEEAAQAALDLRAKRAMPVHWGMFQLAYHTWHDPVTRFSKALEDSSVQLVTPLIGEVTTLNDQFVNKPWWQSLVQ